MNYLDTVEWLRKEYLGIRSNQANPAILDSVRVDMYGTEVPINQVGSILGEGPRTLRINPWDKAAIKPIDSAIRLANLGISVSASDAGLIVSFPELTSDVRQTLLKLAKTKLEEARVRIRNERQKALDGMKDKTEDEQKRAKNELQKSVDDANKKLEDLYQKKEKEILE